MAKFLQKAIKHPGALTAEAAASGRSKLQQAEHDAHSSDPSERARGILGERLISGDLHKAKRNKSYGGKPFAS